MNPSTLTGNWSLNAKSDCLKYGNNTRLIPQKARKYFCCNLYLVEPPPVILYGELNIVVQTWHHIMTQLYLFLRVMEP